MEEKNNEVIVTVTTNFWHSYEPEVPEKGEPDMSGLINITIGIVTFQFGWEKLASMSWRKKTIRLDKDDNLTFCPYSQPCETDKIGGWLIAHFVEAIGISDNDHNRVELSFNKEGTGCAFIMRKEETIARCSIKLEANYFAHLIEFCCIGLDIA